MKVEDHNQTTSRGPKLFVVCFLLAVWFLDNNDGGRKSACNTGEHLADYGVRHSMAVFLYEAVKMYTTHVTAVLKAVSRSRGPTIGIRAI
jgi:hypothetical protein